ncbi:16S rRNA (guanine(527)-N(7))-methyltransferase RsmG [bacterium]|nr:16S rRNA (guanine(527)-N(7))-methyltransferase RsmG [bacterium]
MSHIFKYLKEFTNKQTNVHNLLENYRKSIIIGNKSVNLVSGKNVENLTKLLLSDSLLVLSWSVCQIRSPLIDIGTGAGIPGIPILIAKPDVNGVLLDSNRRKTLFLKKTIDNLNLTSIDVICDRAENIVNETDMHNCFNTIVSRAAAPLCDLLSWGESLLKSGGELIAWKGSSYENELIGFNSINWSDPNILNTESGLTLLHFVKS